MRDVVDALDAVDLVVGRSEGFLPDAELASARHRVQALRERLGYAGDTLVVAIAGGTGSGKSSLLNALAGERIASVSALRPHTDKPLAWVPTGASPGLFRLLDDLNIPDRIAQDLFPGVALVDLPDMDSIATWHRTLVERLLPNVDAVIWVLDPEKYRDRGLHEDFLAPLSRYRNQFLFVLNKIDLIRDEDERSIVTSHVNAVLSDDGYTEAVLYTLAASPPGGRPFGVEALATHLRERLDTKRMSTQKLLADAADVVESIGVGAGVWTGYAIDFDARWDKVRDAAAAGLTPEAGTAAREDALCRVEDFIAAVSVETGGTFGQVLREAFGGERIDADVAAAAKAAADTAGGDGEKRAGPDAGLARTAAADTLDGSVGATLRDHLNRRAQFGATVAYAGVGLAQVSTKLG